MSKVIKTIAELSADAAAVSDPVIQNKVIDEDAVSVTVRGTCKCIDFPANSFPDLVEIMVGGKRVGVCNVKAGVARLQ